MSPPIVRVTFFVQGFDLPATLDSMNGCKFAGISVLPSLLIINAFYLIFYFNLFILFVSFGGFGL